MKNSFLNAKKRIKRKANDNPAAKKMWLKSFSHIILRTTKNQVSIPAKKYNTPRGD